MEIIKDKPLLLITPNAHIRTQLIEQTIQKGGTFYLNDAIVEELAYNADAESFKFSGVYPNLFTDDNEAKKFKDTLEELIRNSNTRLTNLKIKHIDDLLFITYFYTGYSAEVYSNNENIKYLDDLIDVLLDLLDSELTPTYGNYIWIPDRFTGIESELKRELCTEDDLKRNGGFKVYSRMVPPENKTYHFASDRPIVISKRKVDKDDIRLPEILSKTLNETIIKHIFDEHKRANTAFYKELTSGYIDTRLWRDRTKQRSYERENKMLNMLITELDKYLYESNKSSFKTDRREVIYDLFVILQMIPPNKLKRNRLDKASAIRYIQKDNPL